MIEYNKYCCQKLLDNFWVFNWLIIDNEMGERCLASPFTNGVYIRHCPFCGRKINDIELVINDYKDKINGKQENTQGAARVDQDSERS